jgi:hypothetical protein
MAGYQAKKDCIHQLERNAQVTIYRTGHCWLHQHLRKIGLHPTALCEFELSEVTPQHILQTCPNMSIKSAGLLAGAYCPKVQALGNSGGPEKKLPWSEGLIGHGRTQKKKKLIVPLWFWFQEPNVWFQNIQTNLHILGVWFTEWCFELKYTIAIAFRFQK